MTVHHVKSLTGQSMKDVEKALGQPFVERKEDPNILWTYHQENCITLIYFNENKKVAYVETRGVCPDKAE